MNRRNILKSIAGILPAFLITKSITLSNEADLVKHDPEYTGRWVLTLNADLSKTLRRFTELKERDVYTIIDEPQLQDQWWIALSDYTGPINDAICGSVLCDPWTPQYKIKDPKTFLMMFPE